MATHHLGPAEAPHIQRADRRGDRASPVPPISKRDKKTRMLVERLLVNQEEFKKDQDTMYREKLQQIQIDTTLVMRVDPYADRPFAGLEEDSLQFRQQLPNALPEQQPGSRSMLDLGGSTFQKMFHEIQDLVENRDYTLTRTKNDFERKSAELRNTFAFKRETAIREHAALRATLKDRLYNAISARKSKLNKEKEATDIQDHQSSLLHPNQFSISGVASPNMMHTKRTTRLRREVDDGPSAETSSLNGHTNGFKKRKRNGGDDDDAPAPHRRGLDPQSTTAIWHGDRLAGRKTDGPVYTIDNLFTDKELSMTYNTAAVAAYKYILRHRDRRDENGYIMSSVEDSDSGVGDHEDESSDAPLAAPMMERNVSHATRSDRGAATNNGNLMGIESLTSLDLPANLERMHAAEPKIPPVFPSQYIRGHNKQSEFNTPTSLPIEDANADILIMSALKHYDEKNGQGESLTGEYGSRKILEAVASGHGINYTVILQGKRPTESEVRKRLGLPLPAEPERSSEQGLPDRASTPCKMARSGTPAQSPARNLLGGPPSFPAQLGGVSMSRQSSANGAPMSRSSSRRGRSTRG